MWERALPAFLLYRSLLEKSTACTELRKIEKWFGSGSGCWVLFLIKPQKNAGFNRPRRRVRRGRSDFYGGKSNFPEEKSFLADFTTGNRRFQVKSGRGGCGGGACSPVRQTVKSIFDSLKRMQKCMRFFLYSVQNVHRNFIVLTYALDTRRFRRYNRV